MDNVRQLLEQYGGYQGELYDVEEKTLKDTVHLNVSTALTDTTIFQSDTKDRMYKDGTFPIPSQAYLITHMLISTDLFFTPALGTVIQNPNYTRHFMHRSFLEITLENKVMGRWWFFDLMDQDSKLIWAWAVATPYTDGRDKFNNWYQLAIPLKIGAGKQAIIELKFAKALTTGAQAANETPYQPNVTTPSLTTNYGFAVEVYLKGYLFRQAA